MSDKAEHGEIIIIKRHHEEEHESHSSAWKVAHADFMTAMMAFFLIMWLINATDKDTRKAIANYFNPVDLASSITELKGLNDPDDTQANGTSADGDKQNSLKNTTGAKSGAGADRQQGDKERSAFQDPYAVLNKLAGDADPSPGNVTADTAIGDIGSPGSGAGDTSRDPFDPVYWQTNAARKTKTDTPGAVKSNVAPAGARPDATAPRADAQPLQDKDTAQVADATQSAAKGQGAGAASKAGSAAGPAQSGQFQSGQAQSGQIQSGQQMSGQGQATQIQPGQIQAAQALQAELGAALKAAMGPSHAPNLDVKATREGLVINLTDDIDYSMFGVGSAIPDPKLVRAMEKVAKIVAARPGDIVLRGHTDGRPFRSDTYDNWRLSTARAQMAYYMLVRGGLEEARVRRIEGVADRDLKNRTDPYAAGNRRIEILLREPAQ
ncbi:MAG TPA: MotB family protein [Xanthobacteraceae bacterium]|jgi:chemotaxis protein MotB|uniref:MotB family protein n=1 Tax=Roseixanthobacter finlandensis TaxID=3119922 RepID=UPI002CBE162B|nr:MotB family protein [Xanthobacteraceae bacterium]HQS49458.1 MotB family protein [Xanthobacteraceae bacterium]